MWEYIQNFWLHFWPLISQSIWFYTFILSQWQVAQINLVLVKIGKLSQNMPLQIIPGILIEDRPSMWLRIPPVHISSHSNLFGEQLLGKLVILLPKSHGHPFHISHFLLCSIFIVDNRFSPLVIPTCSSLMLSASNFLFSRANLSWQFDICACLDIQNSIKSETV